MSQQSIDDLRARVSEFSAQGSQQDARIQELSADIEHAGTPEEFNRLTALLSLTQRQRAQTLREERSRQAELDNALAIAAQERALADAVEQESAAASRARELSDTLAALDHEHSMWRGKREQTYHEFCLALESHAKIKTELARLTATAVQMAS